MTSRIVAVGSCVVVASVLVLDAQDRSRYRDFPLGGDLASIAGQADVAPADAKLIHQRPAVIQELEWRPRYSRSRATAQTDPVELVVFSFFNDQLFKVVVDYDRDRTEGLTDADMIEAISTMYGLPAKPAPGQRRAAWTSGDDADTLVARWVDAAYSVTLLRGPYEVTYRMIVASTELERLARTADAQAVRLDAREAPQREAARREKETEDTRLTQEKARRANKAAFKP